MKADNNQGDLFKQPISPAPSPVVGNAVPGVPSGAVRKRRGRRIYRTAAFGGRNAGDGVPYAEIPNRQKAHNRFRLWAYALQFYLTAYRAALAFSTRAAKAAESWIAISDRLLRFISMPAFLTPFMNLE